MAWLKLEDTFYDHPKIRKLARQLAINRAQAAGHLALLWSWALRHAADGDLSEIDIEDIEDAAQWQGEYKSFVDACQICGLIDKIGDQIAIHNWISRGGSFAENKRKQRNRDKRKACDGTVPGPSRDCDGTVPEMSRPRVDKSRVDHNRSVNPAAVAADQSTGGLTKPTKVERIRDDIQEVWQHYRGHHPSAAKQLKSNRKEYQLIRSRLEDFGTDELKAAIDGYHQSAFHSGDNKDGKRYQGLTLIMRDVTHVQAGIEMLTAKPSDNGRPRTLDPIEALGDTSD